MGLVDAEVCHSEVLHPVEGARIQVKGKVNFDIDINDLVIPPIPESLTDDEIRAEIKANPITIVAGTVGQDEHSVGLKEIIDIKHGGIEKYGIRPHYLGTSVSPEKIIDAAIETNAQAILVSTIISHDNINYKNMKKIHELAIEKGIRDKILIIAGGTQVTPSIAVENGMDAGFGRGTKGSQVATALVKLRK